MDVDEIAHARVAVEQPYDVVGLGFGYRPGTVVDLAAGISGRGYRRRRAKRRREVPQEVIVTVEVDPWAVATAAGTSRIVRAGRPAVLAPHRVDRHRVMPTIRVGLREDHDIQGLDDGAHLRGADRRATLADSSAIA